MNTLVKMFAEDIRKELTEMKRLGINVPKKAINKTQDKNEMNECYDGGMRVSECADLLINLSSH